MVHAGVHHAVPALLQIRPQLNTRLTGEPATLPFFHAGNGQTCRQNHPKKARILPRKTQMAIRRVLVLIQVGGRAAEGGFAALGTRSLRSRAPKQAHAFSTIRQRKTSARRTGRAVDPLALPCCSRRAESCFYAACLPLFVFHFALKVHQQLFVLHANVFRAVIQFLCRSLLGKPSDIQLVIHFV